MVLKWKFEATKDKTKLKNNEREDKVGLEKPTLVGIIKIKRKKEKKKEHWVKHTVAIKQQWQLWNPHIAPTNINPQNTLSFSIIFLLFFCGRFLGRWWVTFYGIVFIFFPVPIGVGWGNSNYRSIFWLLVHSNLVELKLWYIFRPLILDKSNNLVTLMCHGSNLG